MNRLQNSIVRFLKYVIELEKNNNFIKSFLRVSFIADRSLVLIFAMQEREWSVQQEAIKSWLYILAEMDEI